jgi:hypothetical protein
MNKEPNKEKAGDKEFPGYPHYPANEDITKPDNNNGEVNFNEENITLPDARDIPGQEYITPPPPGIMADTTASLLDEEEIVSGVLPQAIDEDDEVKIVMGTEADVTAEDLRLLGGEDDINIIGAELDSIDEESEAPDDIGSDLDIPGGELDDKNERLGEEDEENNFYSLGNEDNDN